MTSDNRLRDQLIAELDLSMARLTDLRDHLAASPAELRDAFEERVTQMSHRAEELADEVREWVQVRVGTPSAVEDLTYAVDTLEADVDAAGDTGSDGYRARVDRQLRAWRSRVDRLRIQEALAEMELRDELEGIGSRLSAARSSALVELREVADDAREVVADLRDDLEEVLEDVRRVVERAVAALRD
jgi:ElaB/YqjD/DUF883 family membrane-anchored ribosome-binding protein